MPPSPILELPIIGHLYLLKRLIQRTLSEVSKRHGPLLLLQFGSRRVLVVSSPSAAEECLAKNDIVFANRPRMLIGKIMGYNNTSLAWAPYGDHWRNLRRITSLEIFSSSRLQILSKIGTDEAKLLIRRLFHNEYKTVDLRLTLYELTVNVMMRIIAGKRYYGDDVEDPEEAKRFREIHEEVFKIGAVSNVGDFLPWLQSRELEKRMIRCRRIRDEFMQGLIEEHRNKIASNCSAGEKTIITKSLIEILLVLQQETDPEYYSDETIGSLMAVLLAAGTETSSNTIEWALSLLLNHPKILKKAQIEIDNQVGNGRLIDESDMAQLPYLRSIISETLRMYPSLPLLVPHESSDECTVQGYRVPRGTTLLVNVWGIQNDPKIWVDPRKFKPERFEGVEGGRDGFRFMPFGTGRRGCPGEGLGLKMVGLALGSLIQCFDWERIGGEQMLDMKEGTGITMPKAQPLQAKCSPRPTMVNLLYQI